MTISMLQPHRCCHAFFKILHTDHPEDRHHQLRTDQRMLLRSFKDDATDICRNRNSHHRKQSSRIPSDTFPVQGALRRDHGLDQLVLDLFAGKIAAVVIDKAAHQFITDRIHRHDFLLRDAGKVVVKRTAVDDVAGCFLKIRCLVHEHRRISCSGSDGPFPGGQHRRHHAGTSGRNEERDLRMLHHHIAALECRIFHGAGDIVRTARRKRCFIDHIDRIDRDFFCIGMGIEHHRISAGDHADGIADHGLRRIRGRSDGPDHTEGSHFHKGQSPVS